MNPDCYSQHSVNYSSLRMRGETRYCSSQHQMRYTHTEISINVPTLVELRHSWTCDLCAAKNNGWHLNQWVERIDR